MKRKATCDYFSLLLLAVYLLFYLFFGVIDGVICGPDSFTYIQMSIQREPAYPLYLALFRLIAGPAEDVYLQWAVIGQCMITALCSWSLIAWLYKRLSLKKAFTLLLMFVPLAVSLLTRFAAGRHSMYSNTIYSESLAIPLFLLFIRYLYGYHLDGRRKYFILCCILSFTMISIRKQMAVTLALLILLLICKLLKAVRSQKEPAKSAASASRSSLCCVRGILFRIFFAAVGVLGAVLLLDRCYNYCLRDENMSHSGSGRFLTTMVLYTAQPKYGERIKDETARELFYAIYNECEASGYLQPAGDEGWYDRQSHFESHYDHIQINTLLPHVNENVVSRFPGNEVAQAQEMDRLIQEMTWPLLPDCLPDIVSCFFDNFLSGLVTTNAVKRPLFVPLSLAIYTGWIGLFAILLWKKGRTPITDFALLTLCSIAVNVGLVSCLIFCQSRYTIYNMPLFYISGLLMLYEGRTLIRRS